LHATSLSPCAPPWPARLVYSCRNRPGNCCRRSPPPWPSRAPPWPATSELPLPKPATSLPPPVRAEPPTPLLRPLPPPEHRLQQSPSARRPLVRLCAWPEEHGPPPVKLRPPVGTSRHGDAPAPLPRRRRASAGRIRASPCVLCSSKRDQGLRARIEAFPGA
jgi:hypothetical protein